MIEFLAFILTLTMGIGIGYFICTSNYKKSGLLILDGSKWIIDLHIPQDEVKKKEYFVLKVIDKNGPIYY